MDIIGGSPRKTGSALSGAEILEVVEQVYGKGGSWFSRLIGKLKR